MNVFTGIFKVNYFLASFYDAMNIYIKALNDTILNNFDVNNIPIVLKNIWNKEFEGKSRLNDS